MAKVNDLLSKVTLKEDGGYGGKELYVVGLTTAGDVHLLAYTAPQASDMATAIAEALSDTIATEVALAPVYVQESFTVN